MWKICFQKKGKKKRNHYAKAFNYIATEKDSMRKNMEMNMKKQLIESYEKRKEKIGLFSGGD